ncbi:MAG: hypothetical protein A2298_00900 [Gammaproteobacteria bacterium RIFOXYB2_FULL_38_6]|nr:MAG: hypothetical protein A2298_00900 [Gammaproteobacteria bacterium RIFOXYB2_FULL_38_6]
MFQGQETKTQYSISVYKWVAVQFTVVIIASLISLPIGGLKSGLSLLAGGMAVVLPTAFFAYRLFRKFHTRDIKQHLHNFYLSEVAKIILSVALAFIMIMLLPLKLLAFFIGFIIAQIGLWIAPLFVK